MRETKLFRHLTLLHEQQRKSFRKFLASPYFNAQPRLSLLFDALDGHLLGYKLRNLSESDVWGLYNDGQRYDQNKFRKECSALLKQLIAFLVTEAQQNDSTRRAYYLLRQSNDLGMDQDFSGYVLDAQEVLRSAREMGNPDYDAEVMVGLEESRHDLAQAARNSEVDLPALISASEQAHCVRKMELLYLALNFHLVRGSRTPPDEPVFLELVGRHLNDLPPLTRMHYHIYHCTKWPAMEEQYQAFRTLLKSSQIPQQDQVQMYTAGLNHCIRRLNAGVSTYLQETHHLYREMLEHGLLDSSGVHISPHFKNAIVVAARIGELEWARAMMQRFSRTLNLPENLTAKHFGLGVIAYHAGEMQQSESAFHKVLQDFEDVFFGLDARSYLLRIFWETQNQIGLDSMLDSYRMFLKRAKDIPASRKATHNAFIRHLRRLTHLRPHDVESLKKLLLEIQASPQIPVMQWLATQVERSIATAK